VADEEYVDFTFSLDPGTEGYVEKALDRILDRFIAAVEEEGWSCGGACGPATPIDEDMVCQRCDGVGVKSPIPEERKCPTCDGTGEVDPDAMSREEWEEVYGPDALVAQGTEQPPPKRQVEGSNPSESAIEEGKKT
jgi:hypothetical protein